MFTIQLKRLGKKKVTTLSYPFNGQPETLRALIEACVTQEVAQHNMQCEDNPSHTFLTLTNIQDQHEMGKIAFGSKENNTQAKTCEAINNALQGFQDGLFVVFIDDEEIKDLNQTLNLTSKSTITFIRMTFLVGRY